MIKHKTHGAILFERDLERIMRQQRRSGKKTKEMRRLLTIIRSKY